MKKILLLSVLFSGVCMANIGEQFDYNELQKDGDRLRSKLTIDEVHKFVDKYCIGDYAKYKYMIENDNMLSVCFVGFQSKKYKSLMEKFTELRYKFPDLNEIINREHYGITRPGEILVKDLLITRFSRGKSDVDANIPFLVSAFDGIFWNLLKKCDPDEVLNDLKYYSGVDGLCKCIEGASTNIPEDDCPCMGLSHDQIEFLGILRNDVINTVKAYYENLLKFVHDNVDWDKEDACEFVVKLCMCTIIQIKEWLCKCKDDVYGMVSIEVTCDLCDRLMIDLIEIGKRYGVSEKTLLEVKYAKIRKHERELEKEVNDLWTEIARLEEENKNLRNRN